MRRAVTLTLCLLFAGLFAFGQVGNGSFTGVVTDPAGAVVPGATVDARNTATGVDYKVATTSTGNYTITDLPVGVYTITVAVTGFKTYTHSNLALQATQVLREDVALQVGASSESVTVTAEATLLKTETGELSHNVSIDQLDELPLLGIGAVNAGSSGFRNPYATLLTLPGISSYNTSGTFVLNGLGGGLTETMRIEGQDTSSRIFGTYDYTQMAQPSADSVQEIAYQVSNYSAEFGQAGIAVINMTMKSGTNQYHGSGYDYLVNEDLNAGYPFSRSGGCLTGNNNSICSSQGGDGGKFRPRNRRNDFGGTLGGPISIPKIYNGHNKTFFFFNYEEYLETNLLTFNDTVPTPAFLKGDFSAISPNGTCSLCSTYNIPRGALGVPTAALDPLGRPMYANEIYDPLSRGVATTGPLAGQGYANPFQGNMIPITSFSPVAVTLQNLFQKLGAVSQNNNLTGNYLANIPGGRYSAIPAVKIDHNIDAKDKISFYYSENNTESQISQTLGNADGLPAEIGGYRGTFIPTYTERLNYDRTITPTLLLHLGGGYYHTSFSDRAPFLSFQQSSLGLTGFQQSRQFPSFTGMMDNNYGGMQNIGTSGQGQSLNYEERPTFNANLTWVRGKHTFKAGAELALEATLGGGLGGVTFGTGTGPTSEPFTPGNSLAGYSTGFGYASFLLGDYSSITQSVRTDAHTGQQNWGLFVQDSWKVTRKLTVDYGVRYDLDTTAREQYGRWGQLNATGVNTNAGGRLGNYQYASTCGCNFYKPAYPYAIAPRIGVAYQIDSKTVFRAGWGLTYQFIDASAGGLVSTNGIYPVAATNPAYVPPAAQFVNILTPGAIIAPTWPVTNPNIYPVLGTTGHGPSVPDGQQNRPPRINQFSAGIQREITRDFVLEAEYVGNRAVWLGGPLGFLSQISPAQYASLGLYPYPGTGPAGYNNNADRILLSQPISSNAVIQKFGRIPLPYSGFPTSTSLANSIVPYPQFGVINPSGSPTGNSKYDSLQVKATKRFSHNIQAGGAYTWGQGFVRPTRQDFFNPATAVWQLQQIPPQVLTFNATYTTPKASFFPKYVNAITRGWQLGWYSTYQSAPFLAPPASPTANFLPSEDIRVPGQSLYTVSNINNIHSYNPQYTQVLNPAAWAPCPTNATCGAASPGFGGSTPTVYYKDFRGPRTPSENANIGRNFRIKERMNLQIRGEFVNIFNRTLLPNSTGAGFSPGGISTSNPQNPATKNQLGIYTGGFGVMNTYVPPNTAEGGSQLGWLQPRTGTLIARFTF